MPPLKNILLGLACLGAVLATVLASEPSPPAAAEPQTSAQQRINAAAARACAAGETVVWLDEQAMACRREVRP